MRDEIIDAIIDAEWAMFDETENIGGRASCQDNRDMFVKMRKSQFVNWPDDLLESWLTDLLAALAEGRNLISEKYAWMMESSSPEEFLEIRELLPKLPKEFRQRVKDITGRHIAAYETAMKLYPNITSMGRDVNSSADSQYNMSIETYLRGELMTYSAETLALYEKFLDTLEEAGGNIALMTLEQTARSYGFATLDEFEAAAAKKK